MPSKVGGVLRAHACRASVSPPRGDSPQAPPLRTCAQTPGAPRPLLRSLFLKELGPDTVLSAPPCPHIHSLSSTPPGPPCPHTQSLTPPHPIPHNPHIPIPHIPPHPTPVSPTPPPQTIFSQVGGGAGRRQPTPPSSFWVNPACLPVCECGSGLVSAVWEQRPGVFAASLPPTSLPDSSVGWGDAGTVP